MPRTGRYRVRPEEPADRPAVRAVHIAAFGSTVEADLVDTLRGGDPWFSFVAVTDDPGAGAGGEPGAGPDAEPGGQVVGHVLLSRITVGGEPALALAPLGVLPACQRTGAGSALVRAGLAAAAAAGERLVLVVGDPEYYRRFGFLPASRYGVTGPYQVPDAVFQALGLPGAGHVPRGVASYPPVFAES